MSQPDPHHSQKEQGLDRKQLKTVRQRFLQVNKSRLTRALESLSERQFNFITSLPVFFHVNHPMLPGFVSRSTPKGLANFNLSPSDVKQAQQFAYSFTYQKRGDEQLDIESLFLMGSSGTIAQSRDSDFDVWVCYESHLSSLQIQELQHRCDKLNAYADTIQLEVNFFLMNAERFKQGDNGKLSSDDCGSSQHILLLDEFYRTALLLAGKLPIWWLVPIDSTERYSNTAQQLIEKRYIADDTTLDFGDVKHIPLGEFIGAGIWQLYKGISQPYKSVLKLACIEAYASEHPYTISLSECYKHSIYDNKLEIDELDPYVMIYRKLEQYLSEKNDFERLELIRHCLYLKVGVKLSRYVTNASNKQSENWRIKALLNLTHEWGWSIKKLRHLDERNTWKIEQVSDERNALVSTLMKSYRFLSQFAKANESSAISKQEITILGRKLYAAFERRASKIDKINLGISQQVNEDVITFKEEITPQQQSLWHLYDAIPKPNALFKARSLKQSGHFFSLLIWACVNGVIDRQTQLYVESPNLTFGKDELEQLKKQLLRFLTPNALSIEHCGNAFESAVTPKFKLLIVNAGLAPMPKLQEQGIQRLSSRADALSYGGLKENLVHSIDVIEINSWHEVTSNHFSGDDCLLNCLAHQLTQYTPSQLPEKTSTLPKLKVFCFSPSHTQTIANRVLDLFQSFNKQYYRGTNSNDSASAFSRYIFTVKNSFALIQYQGKSGVKKHIANNFNELITLLQAPQHTFSPIFIDPLSQCESGLDKIAEANLAGSIQVFITENEATPTALEGSENHYTFYIADENGSIFHYQTQHNNIHVAITPLAVFLQSCQLRQQRDLKEKLEKNEKGTKGNYSGFISESIPEPAISFYLMNYTLQKNKQKDYKVKTYQPSQKLHDQPILDIQAIAEKDDERIIFTLYCDHQELSALAYGEDVYQKAAEFILKRRGKKTFYPCYITDLDLSNVIEKPSNIHIQTVQYLEYKVLLETRLNRAIKQLIQHL